MKKTITKKKVIGLIKQKIVNDDTFALKALMAVYNRQTPQEQGYCSTLWDNDVGFNAAHARDLSKIARHYQRYGKITPRMMVIVKSKLPHYAKQLSIYGVSTQKKIPKDPPKSFLSKHKVTTEFSVSDLRMRIQNLTHKI